jgi:hypothetical protein
MTDRLLINDGCILLPFVPCPPPTTATRLRHALLFTFMAAPPRACQRHALLPLARIPVGQQSATRTQSLLYLGAEPRPFDALVTLSAWACSIVPSLPRVCTLINHPHPPSNNPCLSPAHNSSFPLQPKQSLPRYSTNYAKPTLPDSRFVMKLYLHPQPNLSSLAPSCLDTNLPPAQATRRPRLPTPATSCA